MASPNGYDYVPMLPVSDKSSSSSTRPFTSRSRSVSLRNASSTIDVFENSTVVLGYTDPLGTHRRPPLVQMGDPLSSTRSSEPPFPLPHPPSIGDSSDSVGAASFGPELASKYTHLMKSGKLGMCNDPYCTTCPPGYNREAAQIPTPRVFATSDSTLHDAPDDDPKGWARRFATYVDKYLPAIIDPETSSKVQNWNIFFAFSCLLSIFVDPLFFFAIEVSKEGKCIRIDSPMAGALVALRSLTDFLFCVNILLQFRLAYVAPGSTVVGSGELVLDPLKIASRYCRGKFILDLLIVLPLPQILIVWIIPHKLVISGENTIKNLLCTAVVVQCIPKLHRLFHLLAGQRKKTRIIFESAWASFFINLFTFILAGHVVGSCWYLFGLQRVNKCLRETCDDMFDNKTECKKLIDCGRSNKSDLKFTWNDSVRASACFQENGFHYGIYWKAVNLTHDSDLPQKYIYSLVWGFQQISTLAGNLSPSYYIWEALFTMAIIGLGLFLFALLIGNMQNFLQSLGRRNMEMTLRRRDVDKWMSHRQFPDDIRAKVKNAEQLNWVAARGVDEEFLLGNMPDDLQRDIRRHLFAFLKEVRIFSNKSEPVLDAIREKLKYRTYLKDSMVLHRGDLVKKMVIIVRGEMLSTGEDGSRTRLSKRDICGEELLTWCQERSSVNPDGTRITVPSKGLLSNKHVCCVTNVEAFSLSIADLEDITSLFLFK